MVNKEDLNIIEKLYDFRVYDIDRLNSSSLNNVFYVYTSIGEFVVKIYSSHVNKSWISFQENHINYLIKNKLINKNLFIKNIYGHYFSSTNNYYVCLSNYMNYNFFQLNNQSNIRRAANFLAVLHGLESPHNFRHYRLPKLNHYFVDENELRRDQKISHQDIEKLKSNYYNFKNSLKIIEENIDLLPKCIIHGDIHSRNILFNNSQIIVIDWDDSCIGPRILDLLKAVYSLCKIKNGSFIFLRKNIKEFLIEYQSYVNLTELELQLIKEFLMIIFTTNLTHYKSLTNISQKSWYLDWTFQACAQIEGFASLFKSCH